ncbi:MAG TPA: hypothetical protein VM715_22255, partial [Candidatus Acidoferrum sp.]|nr:hypothetical protein [Candidatus Acidoferrum sp.]
LFRAPDAGARRGGKASSGKALSASGRSGNLEKPVDGVAEVLHNPASLLLMQRRRTERGAG